METERWTVGRGAVDYFYCWAGIRTLEAQNSLAMGCIQLSIRQAGPLASGPLHMLLCLEHFLSFFLCLEESD